MFEQSVTALPAHLSANPEQLPSVLRSLVRCNEPLQRRNAWRVGGSAEYFHAASERKKLCLLLRELPTEIPVTVLGRGSNVLIRDGGIRGMVITMSPHMVPMSLGSETVLQAGAGAHCARVARFAADHGLSGTEFLAGIPGNIGGALRMNAGAWGRELWDVVQDVDVVNRRGELYTLPREDFGVAYRSVSMPEQCWFVACRLRLSPADSEQCLRQIRNHLLRRAARQPIGERNCGSVFRNPSGDHAARLIDACGLGGYRIGGACISPKHVNFIINTGHATSADIEQLIDQIRQCVLKRFGVWLYTEVHILGERG